MQGWLARSSWSVPSTASDDHRGRVGFRKRMRMIVMTQGAALCADRRVGGWRSTACVRTCVSVSAGPMSVTGRREMRPFLTVDPIEAEPTSPTPTPTTTPPPRSTRSDSTESSERASDRASDRTPSDSPPRRFTRPRTSDKPSAALRAAITARLAKSHRTRRTDTLSLFDR